MRRSLTLAILAAAYSTAGAASTLQEGDIVFQTSLSAQSVAVQRATGSKYSHMGMVIFRNGKPYVFEAISTVQYTPLDQWVGRGAGRHFVAKRLREADTLLTASALQQLRAAADKFAGRPYDLYFGWSDDRIYCSELVWKAYDRSLGLQIGQLQRVRDFNLSDPAVKVKMRERYGSAIPLNESVISPIAMFQSPLLATVLEQ
jgi:uncharacterized protein YycO